MKFTTIAALLLAFFTGPVLAQDDAPLTEDGARALVVALEEEQRPS